MTASNSTPAQLTGMSGSTATEQCGSCLGGCNVGCEQGCGGCCKSPWYASASALVLGRSDGRRVWTSFDSSDETVQLTNTQFGMQWKWGGEVTVGRRFGCGCSPWALEATYWTTDPMTGYQSTTNPGGYVSTPLNLSFLTFNGGAASLWFDGAQEHRLWRRDELHDVEINLVRQQVNCGCDSSWDLNWSLGVRYFRFQDYLGFGTLSHDATGWDDLLATAYLNDTVNNNLVGPQIGFEAGYCVRDRLRLFIAPSFGIYDNFMDTNFVAQTGSGIVGEGPYGSFPVRSSRNGVSFLTQVDLGGEWQFSDNWSLRAGYRVLAATGMALADEQFPQYLCDTPEIANIQHSSSLVLHGAFFGVTYNY